MRKYKILLLCIFFIALSPISYGAQATNLEEAPFEDLLDQINHAVLLQNLSQASESLEKYLNNTSTTTLEENGFEFIQTKGHYYRFWKLMVARNSIRDALIYRLQNSPGESIIKDLNRWKIDGFVFRFSKGIQLTVQVVGSPTYSEYDYLYNSNSRQFMFEISGLPLWGSLGFQKDILQYLLGTIAILEKAFETLASLGLPDLDVIQLGSPLDGEQDFTRNLALLRYVTLIYILNTQGKTSYRPVDSEFFHQFVDVDLKERGALFFNLLKKVYARNLELRLTRNGMEIRDRIEGTTLYSSTNIFPRPLTQTTLLGGDKFFRPYELFDKVSEVLTQFLKPQNPDLCKSKLR